MGVRKMKAFFELHIEQGPILEAEGVDIGVVMPKIIPIIAMEHWPFIGWRYNAIPFK